ncbi:GNAT family N-acetyltransferase [Streptomyces griseus]|uniref:N-acetyltransferase domain-containing protein n=1 Tax=Streptomyces sp. CMC78 TaxID=3231512 RepID=A0AB33KRA3_9ACTN|nr:GNAT family N-acetyltransferase [Streptomyces griseus]WTD68355.1 GNAT family N-acetyltransferase [Streptomyces griseus]
MTGGQQHQYSVRPATPEDLGDLQALARRTIDACYRGFLGGPTVDLMMIDPDEHRRGLGRVLLRHAEETLLARYPVIRLETFPDNVRARAFSEVCGWASAGLLEDEGPAKLVYTRSGVAPY